MKERPILFSGEMVRAILDGRKTQTRRVVKPRNIAWHRGCSEMEWSSIGSFRDGLAFLKQFPGVSVGIAECPYGQPGDRLWVRETWKPDTDGDISCTTYRADGAKRHIENTRKAAEKWLDARRSREQWPDLEEPAWRPSIHMPRWASRITLEVTDVRVERVQDISEADAIAEGFSGDWRQVLYDDGTPSRELYFAAPSEEFATLWDKLNAARGFGWDSNPWVWVVEFKRI